MGVKKNPDPDISGLIPWKPGQSGNPRGNSPEAWVVRRRNAEKAQRIHAVLLESLERWLDNAPSDEARTALIRADILNLTKDSLDRQYGKAGQHVDITTNGDSIAPKQLEADLVIEALKRKHGADT